MERVEIYRSEEISLVKRERERDRERERKRERETERAGQW